MAEPRTRALVPAPAPLPAPGTGRGADGLPGPVREFLGSLLSHNTRRGYSRDLRDFVGDLVSNPRPAPLMRVEAPRIVEYRDRLIARGLEPSTIARKLAALRSFYDYAVARGKLKVNPADPRLVRAPKRPNLQRTDALSWNQVLALLGAVDQRTPLGRRDYALLMLDVRLGLRRSELVSLRTEDVRAAPLPPHVHIRHGKGEKARRVELRPELFLVLEAYAKDRGTAPGWLFPGRKGAHLSSDMYWRLTKKYAKAAGLDEDAIHPHSLRAAYVTLCLEEGVPLPDIQRSVGHARPETTLGYARDLEQVKSRAPRALDGLKAGAPPRPEDNE